MTLPFSFLHLFFLDSSKAAINSSQSRFSSGSQVLSSSGQPFHFRKYSTFPLRTLLSTTFSTEYSSSSSSTSSSSSISSSVFFASFSSGMMNNISFSQKDFWRVEQKNHSLGTN